MTTITIIFHDGYKDWNATKVKAAEVEGEFSAENCIRAFNEVAEEGITSLNELTTDDPVQIGNVITCMGEENGITFVGS